MKFHILISGEQPDMVALHAAITEMDPAAQVDRDALGQYVRIAASLGTGEVQAAAAQAGWTLTESRIEPQPSECCGGCGG